MSNLTYNELRAIFKNQTEAKDRRILAAWEMCARLPKPSREPYLNGLMEVLNNEVV